MKHFIGSVIGRIGAWLWEKDFWDCNDHYEDMSIIGKLGFQMFCTGLELMGITPEDIEKITVEIDS